jgi:beta-lactamase class C
MALTQTPGAAVVIVKNGQIVFLQGYGVRAAGARDSVDANTVFRIGSLSKGFAGVLTGMLVQDSVLDWNEKVQKRFPEFTLRDRQQAERIELWHTLSHTTGLPYHAYTNLIERGFDIRRIVIDYFPKAPVSGKEGVFFSYQNAAFCVVEEVMLGATGKTYQQLLSEKIFQPAGMRSASCDYASITGNPDKSLPHFQTGYGWRAGEISKEYYNSKAAGGVNASIADMGEWLKLLLGHRPELVSGATLDKVFSPVIKTDKERRIFPGWLDRDAASYALGWRVLEDGPDTIIYHGGYVNGYKGEIAFNRRDDIGICVLFNANSELSRACVPAFFERWKQLR